jgi:hypothetical protein
MTVTTVWDATDQETIGALRLVARGSGLPEGPAAAGFAALRRPSAPVLVFVRSGSIRPVDPAPSCSRIGHERHSHHLFCSHTQQGTGALALALARFGSSVRGFLSFNQLGVEMMLPSSEDREQLPPTGDAL